MGQVQLATMAFHRVLALEELLIKSGHIKEGELQKHNDEKRETNRKAQEKFWNNIKIGSEIEFLPVSKKWNTRVRGNVISKSEQPFEAIVFQVSFSQAAKSHKKNKIYCERYFNPDQIMLNPGGNGWVAPPTIQIIRY